MNKKFLLIVILVMVSIIAGCGNTSQNENNSEGANDQESADLSNVEVPEELKVMNPEVTKMNLELVERSRRIMEEFNNGDNLSDSERKEYEEQLEIYSEEAEAFQEKIQIIDDQEIIENIFDKIKKSEAFYDDSLDVETVKNGEYYSIEPLYLNGQNEDQDFNEGFILGMAALEDHTLFLFGVDGELPETTMVKMEFDYEWLEEEINQ